MVFPASIINTAPIPANTALPGVMATKPALGRSVNATTLPRNPAAFSFSICAVRVETHPVIHNTHNAATTSLIFVRSLLVSHHYGKARAADTPGLCGFVMLGTHLRCALRTKSK